VKGKERMKYTKMLRPYKSAAAKQPRVPLARRTSEYAARARCDDAAATAALTTSCRNATLRQPRTATCGLGIVQVLVLCDMTLQRGWFVDSVVIWRVITPRGLMAWRRTAINANSRLSRALSTSKAIPATPQRLAPPLDERQPAAHAQDRSYARRASLACTPRQLSASISKQHLRATAAVALVSAAGLMGYSSAHRTLCSATRVARVLIATFWFGEAPLSFGWLSRRA